MVEKNVNGDVICCLNCEQPIKCRCIEIDVDHPTKGGLYYFCGLNCYNAFNKKNDFDLDYDFGDYNGHYADCEQGGKFHDKWRALRKQRDLYWKLYQEYHEKHKQLKNSKEQ